MGVIGKVLLIFSVVTNIFANQIGEITLDQNKVTVDDFITLTVSMYKDGAELKEVKNIEKFNVESQSTSSSYQYINGQSSLEKKVIYTLSVKDTKENRLELGPAIIEYDGKLVRTNRVEINVLKTKKSVGKNSEKLYFMNLELGRNSVFKNEEVPIVIKFYNRIRLVEASLETPEGNTFFLKQIGQEKSYRQNVNGVQFQVTELRYLFTPLSSGEVTIPKFRLKGLGVIPDPGRRRQDPFGSFFGNSFFGNSGKRRRISVSTEEKKLIVNELPLEGRPENFQGLVGEYSLRQRLEKNPSNNSYSLVVEILGDGSLGVLSDLDLNSDKISSYQESRENLDKGSLFKLTIIPKTNGEIIIPSKNISFYSPAENRYKKLLYGGQKIFSQGVEMVKQETSFPAKKINVEKNKAIKRTKKTEGRDIFPAKNSGFFTSMIIYLGKNRKKVSFFLILMALAQLVNLKKIIKLLKRKKEEELNNIEVLINKLEASENILLNSTAIIASMQKYHLGKTGREFQSENLNEVKGILERMRFGQGEFKDSDRKNILGLINKVKADFLGSLR